MTTINTVSSSPQAPKVNTQALIVSQPEKLGSILDSINVMEMVSEKVVGVPGDFSGTSTSTGQSTQSTKSARELALENLPSTTQMQAQISAQIALDVRNLEKKMQTNKIKINQSGSAYEFQTQYARLRRLHSLLTEIYSATIDIVERIYIRLFIDKKSVL